MSTIAIIGAGNVGRALSGAFSRAGHDVLISSRRPADAEAVAAETGARAATSNAGAVRDAEIVVLATYYASSAEELAAELGETLTGKVLVDVSNPLKPTFDGLVTEGGPSAAERYQEQVPGARVVKAFNTLFAANQAHPVLDGVQLDGFVAGDHEDAKRLVLDLVGSIGLRPVDAGPLARARELEALGWLNISLQPSLGNTWRTAWKLVGVPSAA
jgi:8-hydroxy-5-deazaflavin:NADPH oxidoreductase